MVIFCAYMCFIGKDWFTVNLYAVGASYLALFLAFFCPESPRWYLVNGRIEEAIETLNYMGRFNGEAV